MSIRGWSHGNIHLPLSHHPPECSGLDRRECGRARGHLRSRALHRMPAVPSRQSGNRPSAGQRRRRVGLAQDQVRATDGAAAGLI